jgi:hypothetical protein
MISVRSVFVVVGGEGPRVCREKDFGFVTLVAAEKTDIDTALRPGW